MREHGLDREVPEVVQCWSSDALAWVQRSRTLDQRRTVAVLSRVKPEGKDAAARVLAWARVAVFSDADRRALGDQDRVRVLPPPVFAGGLAQSAQRDDIRSQLALDRTDIVFGLLADPPESGDLHQLAFSLGLAKVMGYRLTALAPRGGRQADRAARFIETHARRWGLIVSDISLPELVAASDVCFVDRSADQDAQSTTVGPVGLSWAMCSGVPVIDAAGWSRRGVFGEPFPLISTQATKTGRAAVPLVRWLEDASYRIELASAMRSWHDVTAAHGGFVAGLTSLWNEVAGTPFVRPGLPIPSALTGRT